MLLQKGITLFELLVSLSITLILVLITLPLSEKLIAENRSAVIINQLYSAVRFAQAQALTRGETVTFCGAPDQKTCTNDWSTYQIVFIDRNANQVLDANDEMLKIYPPLHSASTLYLRAFLANSYIHFKPRGFHQQNATFVYCGETKQCKSLVISKSGRVRKVED